MANINWLYDIGGDWSFSQDWSDNSVPGAGDDVSISANGNRYYSVTITVPETADSLMISSVHATVVDSSQFTVGSALDVYRGSFLLDDGGSVQGGAITAAKGGFFSRSLFANGSVDQSLASGGTLSGVTFQGTLNLSQSWSALTITNGITFAGALGRGRATIDLHGGANQSSILRVAGSTTLNNVTIDIGNDGNNGTNGLLNYDPSGTGAILTLGPKVTINQLGFNAVLGSSDQTGDGIINDGTINANFSGGVFTIDATNFTNSHKITVSNGDTLRLSGAISATLIKTIANSGGFVSIDGTVTGGTITSATGGIGSESLLATGSVDQTLASGGTLSGVTFRGELNLSPNWAALTIANGITFRAASGAGPATIDFHGGDDQSSILNVTGTTTLDNVTIDIGHDGNSGTNELLNDDPSGSGAVLTLGRTVTIDQSGFTAVLASSDHAGDGIINDGAIDANFAGGVFTIDGTNFTNKGVIAVSNGDTLRLTGAVGATLIDSIANTSGFVSVDGTVTGGTITSTAAGIGSVSLNARGDIDETLTSGGTLSGVAYKGELNLSQAWSALTITNGIRFEGASGTGPATINFHGGASQSSILNVAGTTTLDNVTIDIGHDGNSGTNELLNYDPSGTGAVLTLGPTTTLDQVGQAAVLGSSDKAGDGIVNDGAINANFTGGAFTIDGTNFTNKGVITVSNDDTLRLSGAINAALIADITNSGGFVSINGAVSGGTITAASGGIGSESLLANGAVDQTLASGGTLSGVTYKGTLDLSQSWSALTITNGITFKAASGTGPATIDFNGGDDQSSVLNVVGTTTLNNVTIDVGHDSTTGTNTLVNDDPSGNGAILTLGRTATITQVGSTAMLGGSGHSGDGIVNDGAINVGVAGGVFTISDFGFQNAGTISVSNADELNLQVNYFDNISGGSLSGAGTVVGNISNAGKIEAADGTLELQGAITGAGSLMIGAGATLELDGPVAPLETTTFAGASAVLALTEPSSFTPGLSGFAAGDTIDLTKFAYSATGETVGFTENAANTQGTLTVTDGTQQTSITLFGQYIAAGFSLESDGHSGTAISYTPPAGTADAPLLAVAHR